MEIKVSLRPSGCQGVQCLTVRAKVLQGTPLCILHVHPTCAGTSLLIIC